MESVFLHHTSEAPGVASKLSLRITRMPKGFVFRFIILSFLIYPPGFQLRTLKSSINTELNFIVHSMDDRYMLTSPASLVHTSMTSSMKSRIPKSTRPYRNRCFLQSIKLNHTIWTYCKSVLSWVSIWMLHLYLENLMYSMLQNAEFICLRNRSSAGSVSWMAVWLLIHLVNC